MRRIYICLIFNNKYMCLFIVLYAVGVIYKIRRLAIVVT